MLEPLNPQRLDALLRDDDDAGCSMISAARFFFGNQDVAHGVEALLRAFRIFNPYLFFEGMDHMRDFDQWYIKFYEAPFDRLEIQPAGSHIEIYQNKIWLKSYEILGHPRNWVLMLQWLWAYGEEIYSANVKNGSMVRPLDPCKLAALVYADGATECDFIQDTKAYLSEKKDLASGVFCLFNDWEVFAPSLDRDTERDEKWRLTFWDSPFRSLHIQPSADRGIVDVHAFGKKVASFHIIDNLKVADPQMWVRLLRWTWDYGRRRLVQKNEWQAKQRLVSKSHVKSQCKIKRTEKPLLRKVLNTAGFKAQHGAKTKAKDLKVSSGKDDIAMEDVDHPKDAGSPLSRQKFAQKFPLCTADANAQLGTASKPKDIGGCQTVQSGVEGVNIGS